MTHEARPFSTLESEEEIEAREQQEEEKMSDPTALDRQTCKACHATTTQLAANQCPMCGNPFT